MKAIALKKLFEEKILKGTCFDTLQELQQDKTLIQVNAVRAMIAVNLIGVWTGMTFLNGLAREDKNLLWRKHKCPRCGININL